MVVPYAMRGLLYPSHLSARCPLYHSCPLCKGCRRYDSSSLVCRSCESGHKQQMLCRHGEQTLWQLRRIERAMGGEPIFHPDRRPRSTVVQPEPEEMVSYLADRFQPEEFEAHGL